MHGYAGIVEPEIEAPLALCQSDHLPLSEPAQAIRRSCWSWCRSCPETFSGLTPRRTEGRHKPPLSEQRESVLARCEGACYRLLDPDHWRAADVCHAMEAHHVKRLIDAMAASDLAELHAQRDGWSLRLIRHKTFGPPTVQDPRCSPEHAARRANPVEAPAGR